ncbi:MAG TPA: four helix bundle protein [Flavisolibacter sp.]
MATIEKFEDMEVWRLAREQAQSFFALCSGSLRSDFELRNQMNASSGSVMDCIAEGFERSGRSELKNFLVMAKGSNGEYRSQLCRAADRDHISNQMFAELCMKNQVLGRKLMALIRYTQKSKYNGQCR